MKNRILAALRAFARPLVAKLFPEQFKEKTAQEIIPVGGLNVVALKEKMTATMRNRNRLEDLDPSKHTEQEIAMCIGYQKAVRDFEKLWEVSSGRH